MLQRDAVTSQRDRSSGDVSAPDATSHADLRELVVCSLEPWNDVWRRNQFFTDALMRRNPGLRVLYVEPPADVLFDLWSRRVPTLPRLRKLSQDGRLRALRPLKPFPRRCGDWVDGVLLSQVILAARAVGFTRPALWINDVTFAPLIARTGWPSLYDVTDDWLLAPFPPRELERLRRLDGIALARAREVVVCSAALAATRGATRDVSLVPNGVDVAHFRRPHPRPRDLPMAPTAVYVGLLHEARMDVELVVDLARALPHVTLVLVGPSSLGPGPRRLLERLPNVSLLGPRAYRDIPAYLQHADVVIVPHRISAFTESLDPIKAYECLAVDSPTVATPVAGFRDYPKDLNVVDRNDFRERVEEVLSGLRMVSEKAAPADWQERSLAFEAALLRATSNRSL